MGRLRCGWKGSCYIQHKASRCAFPAERAELASTARLAATRRAALKRRPRSGLRTKPWVHEPHEDTISYHRVASGLAPVSQAGGSGGADKAGSLQRCRVAFVSEGPAKCRELPPKPEKWTVGIHVTL